MTRSTKVVIVAPDLAPMDVWRQMATIIKAPEQYRFEVTSTGIHAAMDQGLVALMDLYHAADQSLIAETGCDEWCLPECSGDWCKTPAHHLMADFDTAYSFTDACGCHSGGLHLRLVAELGEWLTGRGARWQWYDESGDGWNHGPDWGTLGDSRGACVSHRAIPAPAPAAVVSR